MGVTRNAVQAVTQQLRSNSNTWQVQLPYALVRNSRGSLPVYSDIRNAGTRYQVQIRNVLGNTNALFDDLRASLFPPDSAEAVQLKGQVVRARHIVLQGRGSHWKHHVIEWLLARGF